MGVLKDLTGQRFDRWQVISRAPNCKYGHAMWLCICDCGVKSEVLGTALRKGHTRSCGCLQKEVASASATKHGMAKGHGTKGHILPRQYTMWTSSKTRAKRNGVPFDLELSDISIPEFCPVFTNVRLNSHNKSTAFDSPSLDRIIPELGYVKGNVRVISYRANTMKQDASLAEIKRLAEWLEGELSWQTHNAL